MLVLKQLDDGGREYALWEYGPDFSKKLVSPIRIKANYGEYDHNKHEHDRNEFFHHLF
jgi:hypothetical protein